MRILAIDHGGRRIGLAICDPLGITVRPLLTLDRRKVDPLGAIAEVIQAEEVEALVLGIPVETSGVEGEAALRVRRFGDKLVARLAASGRDIPLEGFDESYTTTEAAARLRARGVSGEAQRGIIDQEAAAVLLEAYLRERGSRG